MRNLPRFSSDFFAFFLLMASVVLCSGAASAQRISSSGFQLWRFYSGLKAGSTTLSFGSVQDGASKQISETLTNVGRTNVTITAARTSGTGFSISGLTLPTTLTAGHSYTFQVKFSPKNSGASTGSVAITSNAPQVSISLTGTGVGSGTLAVSPTSISFGSVAVGSSKSVNGTLSASGSNVVVSSAGTNSAEYTMSGITLPLTIQAGKTATFTMMFRPQSSGSASAKASFVSNASNASLTETLSGTGISSGGSGSAPTHSVSLTWQASTSSVAGYNIYRSAVSGGPYTKLNSSPDTATVYTDSAVTAGKTYYYVATAINSSGTESATSNQVTAKVPTP
jgi:hypothetical protein